MERSVGGGSNRKSLALGAKGSRLGCGTGMVLRVQKKKKNPGSRKITTDGDSLFKNSNRSRLLADGKP